VSGDEWNGEFLLLPGLYNRVSQPKIRFLGIHGQVLPVGDNVGVQMASSAHTPSQLSALLDQDVLVVVSDDVVKRTLVLQEPDGVLQSPRFVGSAFTLPAPKNGELAAIHALTYDGLSVGFNLGFDVNLADLEEEALP
jgi:hypothetical protein